MEKEIGSMAQAGQTGAGGVLKEEARNRFFKGKIEPRGFAGKLRSVAVAAVAFLACIAVIQFVAAEKFEIGVKVIEKGAETEAYPPGDGLDFGSLPQGNSSMRYVTIKNGGERDVYVKIIMWGEASGFMETNRNDFTLGAGKSENLEFKADIPSGADMKEYYGRVAIFKVPEIF